MIEKLNMQAIISASSNETEYVKDSLLTFEKVWENVNQSSFFKYSDYFYKITDIIIFIIYCLSYY